MRRAGSTDAPVTGSTGFAWWDPHDRARRAALFLLALTAAICATYAATAAVAVVVALRVGHLGPWRGLETWQHRLGPAGIAAALVLLVGAAAALIAWAALAGFGRRVLRWAGARSPQPGEATHARDAIAAIALGEGIEPPLLMIVDDGALNALTTNHFHASTICLTRGALDLPHEELEALCAHAAVCTTNRAATFAGAAADLVVLANWCTKVIWGAMCLIIFSSLLGVSPLLVAMTILAAALIVTTTKPLLAVANRAIVHLLDDAALLADLETVRVTNHPAALANLLLSVASGGCNTSCGWQIAHLWFVPATAPRFSLAGATASTAREKLLALPRDLIQKSPPIEFRRARSVRSAFIARAHIIGDLAPDDTKLHARIASVEARYS